MAYNQVLETWESMRGAWGPGAQPPRASLWLWGGRSGAGLQACWEAPRWAVGRDTAAAPRIALRHQGSLPHQRPRF